MSAEWWPPPLTDIWAVSSDLLLGEACILCVSNFVLRLKFFQSNYWTIFFKSKQKQWPFYLLTKRTPLAFWFMKSLLWDHPELIRGSHTRSGKCCSRISRPLTSPNHFLPQNLGWAIDTGPLLHLHWWWEFGNTVLQFKIVIFAKTYPVCTNKDDSKLNSQPKVHRCPLSPQQLLEQVNSEARKTELPWRSSKLGGRPTTGTCAWLPALSPAPVVTVLSHLINLCKLTIKKIQCHSYGKQITS